VFSFLRQQSTWQCPHLLLPHRAAAAALGSLPGAQQ